MPAGYRIRGRRPIDDAALLGIENRAAQLFRHHGYPAIADAALPDIAALRRLFAGNRVWVATAGDDTPVGYAVAGPLQGYFHLYELSVDPAHGRRGLGAALVKTVLAAAVEHGCTGVSLTTFRFVAFNRPFYQRLGFAELPLDAAPSVLRDAFKRELPQGIDMKERLLMLRRIGDPVAGGLTS